MSDTKNFFENPNAGNGSNAGWGAGVGGLIGAAIGNGGFGAFGGNREPSVTPDQLGVAINGLRTQIQGDQVEDRIAGVTAAVGASTVALSSELSGIKDTLNCNNGQLQLTLCGLGNSMAQGFAAVNQTILLQGAASRELALQQALDAERARATELRIALSEGKNAAGHAQTQVLLNQVINAQP